MTGRVAATSTVTRLVELAFLASQQVRALLIRLLALPIHLYRLTALVRQPRCRYHPSCSTYALGALRVHGPVRGALLGTRRVLRCHPWSAGGVDPVPLARSERPAPIAADRRPGVPDA
jgi:uncharacterized protein